MWDEPELFKALNHFATGPWSLVVEKGSQVLYRSKRDGLQPLLDCIKRHEKDLVGARAYDRILGRAAVLLWIHAGIGVVLTPLMSNGAAEALEQFGVRFLALDRVEGILDSKKTGPCPMEDKARDKSPLEFYSLLAK